MHGSGTALIQCDSIAAGHQLGTCRSRTCTRSLARDPVRTHASELHRQRDRLPVVESADKSYPYVMSGTLLLDLISPVVAVAIALWGFRRSTRADKLRAFFEIHERYLASDVRAGRRIMHTLIAGRSTEEVAKVDPVILSAAGYALAVMNSIAIACEAGYVDQELIAQSMGRSFILAISAARPYIDHLENKRGFRPYPFGERLASRLTLTGSGTRTTPRWQNLIHDSKLVANSPSHHAQTEGSNEGSKN
jgi:hypothetical protein